MILGNSIFMLHIANETITYITIGGTFEIAVTCTGNDTYRKTSILSTKSGYTITITGALQETITWIRRIRTNFITLYFCTKNATNAKNISCVSRFNW